jgi:hypothetical protein
MLGLLRTADNPAVTLNLGTLSPLRSLARQRELVQAIYNAPSSTQETEWLEWKSRVDIGEKRWQAELSRQVLGMANREPAVAAKWVGGCGLIVVGVSPGELVGTRVYDTAEIEGWLTRYVGRAPNAPEWAPAYVEVDERPVLILTVEPPQVGQAGWPCRKTYSPDPRIEDLRPVRDGAVFVRHKASTEEATSADMDMLSRRAVGGHRRIAGISLLLAPDCRAVSLDVTEAASNAWAEREREALMPPTPPPPPQVVVSEAAEASLLAATKILAELGAQMDKGIFERDKRTPAAYQAEVDAYIAKATTRLAAVVVRKAYEQKLGRIDLSVRNETDDPIHKLQVELLIAAKGVSAFAEDGDLPQASLPRRPIMLGRDTRSVFDALSGGIRLPDYGRLVSPVIGPIVRGVRIDNSNSAHLIFRAVDLYPQETAPLVEFYVLTSIRHAGSTLSAEWTARAGDVSGVIRGTLEILVDPRARTIDELLAREQTGIEDENEGESRS